MRPPPLPRAPAVRICAPSHPAGSTAGTSVRPSWATTFLGKSMPGPSHWALGGGSGGHHPRPSRWDCGCLRACLRVTEAALSLPGSTALACGQTLLPPQGGERAPHQPRAGSPQNDRGTTVGLFCPGQGPKANPQRSPGMLGLVTDDTALALCKEPHGSSGDSPGPTAVTLSAHAAAGPATLGQNDRSGPRG